MKIGVIGLGYVGLPLGLRFCESGCEVVGFDIDETKCRQLNSGDSYIRHIGPERVAAARDSGRFEATADFSRVAEVDAVLICVPTPLGPHREPDMSYIAGTVAAIEPHIRAGQTISLESTTYPGTTEEFLVAMCARRGLVPGRDVFVVYSPEREDPGNPQFATHNIPKLVAGQTPACLERGLEIYGRAIERLEPVSSPAVAEMAKLFENVFRAVNIGLANEIKVLCHRMGIDPYEVIEAAGSKPFGFMKFFPGPGLGGHCIPIDPFYLTWKAHEYGVHTKFIELAGEINRGMPHYVVDRVQLALNRCRRPINGSKVLVLGVAYKKNVDDLRESPALEIIEMLQGMGAEVSYHDPYFPALPKVRRHDIPLRSVDLTDANLAQADAVVIATDHDVFDYERIRDRARLVIDCRGRLKADGVRVVQA
ncbi:MAG: nucleotide sugar dehydrogenase [Fimbriimonadaceae bacterium]